MIRPLPMFVVGAFSLMAWHTAHANQYIGYEGFYSSDADRTEIAKTALDIDFEHANSEHYQGLSLEEARYRPFGQSWIERYRAYFRFADSSAKWKWNGRIGGDGHALLGSADVHNEDPFRQEYFAEREIVETPVGLRRGLYSTYSGAAFDVPFDARNILTTVVGVQDFSGRNVRLQYKGNFIHVLVPEWGLSAQLRVRYFHDSVPEEFDYFSPRWYVQAIPTLQLRRYVNGWRYAIAAGYGRQDTADSAWHDARLLEATMTSPKEGHDWVLQAGFTYANTPINSGFIYDYKQLTLSVGRSF
ncbi:MAG TPA: hypothetical protein VK660_06235 [Xanthomonadaceae bacterium]|jgi:hypothetical protein|nr:hypothetical protein [Xanthomonadaceae bacterium]